jgi:luciferase family oxidoreductase group 1
VIAPHVPLSVLDLAPVGEGSSPAAALQASLGLAREAERLGYARHSVAEHHNMPGIASSSPPVLLAHAAAVTTTMRLGSGGVMLPNHSALVVAEQFGMLEALHPGRIDLGIGRAPGTDQLTARALRRNPLPVAVDDFPEQLIELFGYFDGAFPHATGARGHQSVDGLARRRKPGHGSSQVGRAGGSDHADELMVTTMTHGPAARLRSYRLVAEAVGLAPRDADPPSLLEGRAVG